MSNTIAPNTHLFATYVGLTVSGYGMADHRDQETQALISRIRGLEWPSEIADYFATARTGKVEVNPYWPRGSMLSTASLYIGADHALAPADRYELEQVFLQAENVGPEDKTSEALGWIMRLPEMVAMVMQHPAFAGLWSDYLALIRARSTAWDATVRDALRSLASTVGVPEEALPAVVFVPNLLQSPYLADFAVKGNTLSVIRTEPDAISIVHELLHSLFDTAVRQAVETLDLDRSLDEAHFERMKSMGYAWGSDRDSLTRIMQESCVRAGSIWVVYRHAPDEGDRVAQDYAAWGFGLVPSLLANFRTRWQGLDRLPDFLAECLVNIGVRSSTAS